VLINSVELVPLDFALSLPEIREKRSRERKKPAYERPSESRNEVSHRRGLFLPAASCDLGFELGSQLVGVLPNDVLVLARVERHAPDLRLFSSATSYDRNLEGLSETSLVVDGGAMPCSVDNYEATPSDPRENPIVDSRMYVPVLASVSCSGSSTRKGRS